MGAKVYRASSVGPDTPLRASHSGYVCRPCYLEARKAHRDGGGEAADADAAIADTPPKKRRKHNGKGKSIASSLRAVPEAERVRRVEELQGVTASVERSRRGEERRPVVMSFHDAVRYFSRIRHVALDRSSKCERLLHVAAARDVPGGGTDLTLRCGKCDVSIRDDVASLRLDKIEGCGDGELVPWWTGPVAASKGITGRALRIPGLL